MNDRDVEDATSDSKGTDGRSSGAEQMLNKRPRLLSFQGLSSHSRSQAERDAAVPMAGASSSSMEHINRREQLASDLRSWQENQIAACVEDNILNMVLERYLNFFEERNNRNNVEPPEEYDDETLEDQAIRMLINERGLQAAGSGPSSSVSVAMESVDSVSVQSDPELPELERSIHDNYILETAVAAAIQEKGLVTGSTDAEHSDSDDSALLEDNAR
ncbi:uncharacterized protein LOC131287859 [Anopheles ziemanni]|uniref:uncharacterized protein LOC131272780 n=1 Tax=Anopheles coustani TaxID=139045 RepID=UPI00265A8655|nr:uncharacterized protein LOC131272780 [Anopheles coustani]XP_058172927.1 uncharacterized protein LOC131287859 [Anopheles ziemanni]